ncbi:MAG TPA: hypothetical protein VFJ14_06885 [Nocardioidaceae bacterium]|nr:hypothetical protein [Nocardioidaceae bacterium]
MSLRRVGAGVASAVLLCGVLAGCSGLRPGAAAVVGSETISDEELSEATDNFCTVLTVAQQAQAQQAQGETASSPSIPVRSAATQALGLLVINSAAEQLAAEEGIEVTPAETKAWISSLPPIFEGVPADERDDVDAVTELIARTNILIGKFGQSGSGNLTAAGQQRVRDYLDEVGYEIEQRYGQVLDPQAALGTGSLSVPVSDDAVRSLQIPEGGVPTEAELCS